MGSGVRDSGRPGLPVGAAGLAVSTVPKGATASEVWEAYEYTDRDNGDDASQRAMQR